MIDKENTTIVNGAGKNGRYHEARSCADQGADRGDTSVRRPEKLEEASGQLAAAVAVIRVCGATESRSRSARIALC